jgi:hypothetical protein
MPKEEALVVIKDWLRRCLALPNAKPMAPNKIYDGYIEYYLDYAIRLKEKYSKNSEGILKIV